MSHLPDTIRLFIQPFHFLNLFNHLLRIILIHPNSSTPICFTRFCRIPDQIFDTFGLNILFTNYFDNRHSHLPLPVNDQFRLKQHESVSLDFHHPAHTYPSVSALCQQRDKVSSSALEYIFKIMVAQCDEHVLFKGYRLMAVDGSDLRLPVNPNDKYSFIRNDENTKGYNLLHLDAMYDLLQHIYVEASVQSKRGMN